MSTIAMTPPIHQHYRDEGFVIVHDGLPAPLVGEMRSHLAALIAALPPGGRPENLCEPHVKAVDRDFWLGVCCEPLILDAVAAAMDADELVLAMSHLIVKPPRDGKVVAWHQDLTYWGSITGEAVATVWLAIDDVDPGNACMHVIPRSHGGERLEMRATDGSDLLGVQVAVAPELAARAVPCTLRAGQFSIHDALAIHGSVANTSERRRAGYTMRYADPAQVQIDLAKHWVPVFYLRGDGRHLRPGMIDLRPGTAAVP